MGRLTTDPDVRYSSDIAVARYTLAVDRRFKKDGDQGADFIRCVAFSKQGEFAEKYLYKGSKILIVGRIQTGIYTNREGKKVYTTEIAVEEHYFCESKKQQSNTQPKPPAQAEPQQMKFDEDGFMKIPEGIENEFPF